jgi:hypothetical protein
MSGLRLYSTARLQQRQEGFVGGLFGLDVGGFDHCRPALLVVGDELGEFSGCAGLGVNALLGQLGLHVGQRQRAAQLGIELVDDGLGCLGRATMPIQMSLSYLGTVSAIVGTLVSNSTRLVPVVPSARSLPLRMCGRAEFRGQNITSTWPPSTSTSAGAEPLYAIWVRLVPVMDLKTSAAMCCGLPEPAEA